ncbi:type I restriction enzyme HsdR N-terminal domain-containing protein [Ornithobacterium rhinotracheale]|uniref:type I restriction enzyme HsdR N-terminal domain-containing protein n=1 Tax=Ornithobacterium rhinotracheale TaxID=28251 RepID=UPI00129C3CD0|nr:type I restriction enzyme HsdR N-terminal domain-containing protein [Ornithobacterium rhinotracheale]MRJ07896.1 type I restriction enzyme HsdR N-terminal domain-containing protein [Ornithobacterium rhinotracheale]UOH78590.1 type I restriction enzyme HsdR N-terminal domain-containing protein [Ornithobacterium rhinotracheale]
MLSNSFIKLPVLNFPEKYQFRIKKTEKTTFIFCAWRKKWLVLTPEEWVRQHVLQFLVRSLNYRPESIGTEIPVKINGLPQRADCIVYQKAQPFILCECKKPEVKITQKTMDQILRYNQEIRAPWIYLTNGIQHIVAQWNDGEIQFQPFLPENKI